MKKITTLHLLALIAGICIGWANLFSQTRLIQSIDDSWKFTKDTTLFDPNFYEPGYDDSSWDDIDLPHTWNNFDGQDGGENYYRGIGCYRKALFIGDVTDKKIFLKFNAANLLTKVYFNGTLVGTHIGGYSAFVFDVTNYVLQNGDNLIAVMTNNSDDLKYAPLSADFTFCGGITKSVELWTTNEILVSPLDYASPGVYITPKVNSGDTAEIRVDVMLANYSDQYTTVSESYVIKDVNDMIITSEDFTCGLSSDTDSVISRSLIINDPVLWQGVINPHLYKLELELTANGNLVDQLIQTFGIRYLGPNPDTLLADRDSGIYLNGNHCPLHGVALHEDRKNKGRAISDQDRKEDLDILRETGLNYLRLSHYQHGQYTYDYCDSTGILVWTEIPLIDSIDSISASFSDNAKEQLKELIKQNYNHPSVCFWGLFNEIETYTSSPDATQIITELNDLAKSLDNTRFTVGATNTQINAFSVPDLISFNVYHGWYEETSASEFGLNIDKQRNIHQDCIIGVSEYGAGASINQHEENPDKPICNGNYHPEEYQNYLHEEHWKAIIERPYLWETSVWVGFDFASDKKMEGDTYGINDKGLVTHDRSVKKDVYYFYKANWNEDPMVYITSKRFDRRNTMPVEVKVYSNIDTVHLRVNNGETQTIVSGEVIKKWTNITLKIGENKIYAEGTKNGSVYKDSCTWHYILFPGDIRINFQPDSIDTPVDYLEDSGEIYGDRGNGHFYGWLNDNTINTRLRGTSGNLLYRTLNHMQNTGTDQVWEIELEEGAYEVGLVCGDSVYFDSKHSILAENKNVLLGEPTSSNPFIANTDTVVVMDGRLTLKPDSNAKNAKINFIHISKIELPIPPGKIQINFQPDSINTPDNYLEDSGEIYGDRGNGYFYGWLNDNTDNTRLRGASGDLLYRTLNHMQNTDTDQVWEIELDNGAYRVSLVCGDPDYFDSNHSIKIENKNFLQGESTGDNPFITNTDTVIVLDGRLTLKPDSNSENAKINFIHITKIELPAPFPPGDIQINFQPDSINTPNGYLEDSGEIYGDRSNGHFYGWLFDNTENTRLRGTTGNLLYRTLNHMQNTGTDQVWEIELDSGAYRVSLVCGDSVYFDSKHSILAEYKNVIQGEPTSSNPFIINTDTVIVLDGRLTLKPDSNSENAKINFIHITKVELPVPFPPGDIQINFQPDSINTPVGYLEDSGEMYGDRGNGYFYGWLFDNTENTRLRGTSGNLLYRTLNHMQNTDTDQVWEIDLDSGTYSVSLVCGDSVYFDSKHSILAEYKNVLQGEPTSSNPFIINTDTVEVLDGRLTLRPDSNSENAKINFIHITKIDPSNNPIEQVELRLDQFEINGIKNRESQIKIYPIPFNDHIVITGLEKDSYIEIRNILGKPIYRGKNNRSPFSIETGGMETGMYVLTITRDATIIGAFKIVHQ